MKLFTGKTFLEVLNQILINLSAAWFGIILIAPGIFDVPTGQEYLELLLKNLPFGILSLLYCSILAERIKSL